MHSAVTLLLEEKAGVIDLRSQLDLDTRRIRRSLHISGLAGLQTRFSWLPPPQSKDNAGLPLVVICGEGEAEEARVNLSRWNVASLVDANDQTFWKQADDAGLCTAAGEVDIPDLLFQPSALVVEAYEELEGTVTTQDTLTVLDLGCGAGRDLAWIVRQKSKCSWLATGIDNLAATVRRALCLCEDMKLSPSQGSRIEHLLWAQATSEGLLEALHHTPGSKSRGVPVSVSPGDDTSLSSFAAAHLPHQTYDLVLLIRFLPRALLVKLPELTHAGSIIALSHFTSQSEEPDYPSPHPSKRLEAKDIEQLLSLWSNGSQSWGILRQSIDRAEDGRPIYSVLLQRRQ